MYRIIKSQVQIYKNFKATLNTELHAVMFKMKRVHTNLEGLAYHIQIPKKKEDTLCKIFELLFRMCLFIADTVHDFTIISCVAVPIYTAHTCT